MSGRKKSPDVTNRRWWKYVEFDEDGDIILRTPYNKRFITLLKNLIDRDSRRWVNAGEDPSLHGFWHVDVSYSEELWKLMDSFWGDQNIDKTAYRSSEYWSFTQAHVEKPPSPPIEDLPTTMEGMTARLSELMYELEDAKRRVKLYQEDAEHSRKREDRYREERNDAKAQLQQVVYQFELLKNQYDLLRATGGLGMGRDASGPMAEAYKTLHLAPGAPADLVETVWKALMLKHHPDRGGDLRLAQAINAAHDTIIGR